jgi:bacteriorhodopsin
MGKGISVAVLTIVAAVAADQYFNFGYYTDGTLAMLRQIQHSFGR